MLVKKLNTVLCAIATPFKKDGEIDFEGFKRNIEWYISQGIGGIVVCGGTGEFVSLSKEERKQLAQTAADQVAGRMALVIGCAAETTSEAIEFTRHAKEINADGVMIISSYYFKPSPEELFNHFKQISESVDIPIILYNNPGCSGTDVKPELATKILQLKNVVYMKEASGDLRRIRQIKELDKENATIMCGCDEIICESILNGAKGWISITANIIPKESQRIFDLLIAGNVKEAKELFNQYDALYKVCETEGKAFQIVKYILDKRGLCGEYCRLPRLPLTESEIDSVEKLIKKVKLNA